MVKNLTDIKSCWDLFTFETKKVHSVDPMNKWQITGYCDLADEPEGTLAYCLINTPEQMIDDEKYFLKRKMGVIDEENNADYRAAAEQIDVNMRFDDIPMEERVHKIVIPRVESEVKFAQDRVVMAREHLLKTYPNFFTE